MNRAMPDPPNTLPERPKMNPRGANHVDLLSDVLRTLRVSGAVFLRGEFSAPWGFESPCAEDLAAVLSPGAPRLVLFHVVVEGACHVTLDTGESAHVRAGELVMLPYGNQHTMSNPDEADAVPIAGLLPPPPWESLVLLRHGTPGGASTGILCSYLHCADGLFNPLLKALPALMKVSPSESAAEWIHATVRYAMNRAEETGAGSEALLTRLPEILFVEALRQFVESLPDAESGWLSAIRDPVLGPALAAIHADPARPWTVDELARKAATSRSVLAARFVEQLDQSPMRYLTNWRLQLATHLLTTGDLPVGVVAGRVGYDSEAAFSRMFRRHLGLPPATWRDRNR